MLDEDRLYDGEPVRHVVDYRQHVARTRRRIATARRVARS